MTIKDDIAAGTRAALAAISGGELWGWAARTGKPDTDSPTFASPPTDIGPVQLARRETTEVYNEKTGAWERIEVATIRVPSTVDMAIGDRVTDPDDLTWSVTNREGSGIGTWRYSLRREVPLLGGADRGGGI